MDSDWEQDADWYDESTAKKQNRRGSLTPEEIKLDEEYGNSANDLGNGSNGLLKAAWEKKLPLLRPGDVIFCRAHTNLIHLIVALGQIRNYGSELNNYFRFWTHAAIVVKTEDAEQKSKTNGNETDENTIVVQASAYGVEYVRLNNFLDYYQYRCWAFRAGGLDAQDASQIKHALNTQLGTWNGKESLLKKLKYGVVTLLSVLLAHIFENLRIQFHLVGQFTCAGLVAELLERGKYVFKKGATHSFPSDVAVKVMSDKSITEANWKSGYAPRAWSFRGYHDGVNRLFQQLNGDMLCVFFQVILTIFASFVVCGFFVYIGAAIANTAAPDLFVKLRDSRQTVPVFLVSVSIIILGIAISTRKYPITWLFWMSVTLSFFTLPFVSFDNDFCSGASIESFINALFDIWSFAALALGIATVVFSIYAFVILTSYLLYPYLYWLARFVWLPIRDLAFRQSS